MKSQTIVQVQKKPSDSRFSSGLLKVNDTFLDLGHFQLNNGANIRFWEVKWLGNFTLKQYYPSLYLITHKKYICVQSVFSTIPLNISFQRGLVGNNLNSWYNLVARVAHIRLINTEGKFLWDLHQTGIFSVKSMYNALICDNRVRYDISLWKLKIPLKIKIFMW
jgi:hypothetical protein